jgi:hypothetical protein
MNSIDQNIFDNSSLKDLFKTGLLIKSFHQTR